MMRLLSSQLQPSPVHTLPIRNEQVRESHTLKPYQQESPKPSSCGSRCPNTSPSTPDLEPSSQTSQTEEGLQSLKSRYGKRHRQRKQCLLAPLKSLFDICDSENSFVLICRGSRHRCRIRPVKIPNSADDMTKWQSIRNAWYEDRGQWRKFIRFFDVKQVSHVKVRHRPIRKMVFLNSQYKVLLAGLDRDTNRRSRTGSYFIGTYSHVDLDADKNQCEKIMAEHIP